MKFSDRFFVGFEIKKGIFEINEKKFIHQLKKVLRKKIGEKVILLDGSGREGIGEIKNFEKNKMVVEILEIKENEREPKIFVSLFCSILKKANFEFVVQKATEIGVKEIFPIICKNTVKLGLKMERLKKIAKEAAEQSKRGVLPTISKPIDYLKAIERARNSELKILFDSSGRDFFKIFKKAKKISIFVGPEGGWSKEEIELAKSKNFEIVNLGKLNLRAETAATVGSFLAANLIQNE